MTEILETQELTIPFTGEMLLNTIIDYKRAELSCIRYDNILQAQLWGSAEGVLGLPEVVSAPVEKIPEKALLAIGRFAVVEYRNELKRRELEQEKIAAGVRLGFLYTYNKGRKLMIESLTGENLISTRDKHPSANITGILNRPVNFSGGVSLSKNRSQESNLRTFDVSVINDYLEPTAKIEFID